MYATVEGGVARSDISVGKMIISLSTVRKDWVGSDISVQIALHSVHVCWVLGGVAGGTWADNGISVEG